MRRLVLLGVFCGATALTSWASGTVDLRDSRSDRSNRGFATPRWSGFTPFNMRESSGEKFGGARLGSLLAENGRFEHSQEMKPWLKDASVSLDEKGLNVRHEHFKGRDKGRDDDRGEDGGRIALPVPEPGTLSLLGAGLVGLAGFVRRRRNAGTL